MPCSRTSGAGSPRASWPSPRRAARDHGAAPASSLSGRRPAAPQPERTEDPLRSLPGVLAPRDRQFFDLFEEAGQNILRAADLLDQMLRGYPENANLARDILICEQEGDRITHDIIRRLNETFVTPIDREDIHELASALDDVVDYAEEAADYLGLYKIEAPM